MKITKWIACLAFAGLAGSSYAQSCAGHAHAEGGHDMASISKELGLTTEQQAAFTKALDACQKDCTAMASKGGDEVGEKKQARFNEVIVSMKEQLKPQQFSKLEAMNAAGQLNGLCGEGGKGCCAGKSAASGKSCCAGKAHAAAPAEHKENKAETGSSPSLR